MHSKLITEERGQSMAEFAIVLPVLVVVLFGIIQFGILFNNYVTLTDAVRAGARTAAVSRQDPDPSGEAATMVRTSAANLDQSNLNVSVSSDWQSGDDVTVTATYPYSISLLGWVVSAGNLTTTTTDRVE
ncbi:MAG TPA: TadE/TadG family type IV pilus assembly protein [Gaiellaceae bacterium]|nr:TadE/TadG family type IV pilus assembly protein [Gaiellaceae bacterium]